MLFDPAAAVGKRPFGLRSAASRDAEGEALAGHADRVDAKAAARRAGVAAGFVAGWHGRVSAQSVVGAGPAQPASAVAASVGGGSVPVVVAVLIALVALAVAGWAMRLRHIALGQVHAARVHLRNLGDVLDLWQWQTDASHRIVVARPPPGAPAEDWNAAGLGVGLHQLFTASEGDDLKARMASAAPLDDVDVTRIGAFGGARRGRLRGRAMVDASGRFGGYVGTVREDRVASPGSSGVDASPQAATVNPAPATARPAAPSAASKAGPAAVDPGARGTDGPQPIADPLDADRESFSYTVSHDLRAPIRVVEGFTKIVKEDYGRVLDRVGHDHLDRVLGAAARMNGMIDALLALSKLSSQPVAQLPVDLSQLAAFVVEDLRRQTPGRTVAVSIEPDMLTLGDPTLLRLVLENLLGNAWKYTGRSDAPQIWFERHADAPASFTVRDNGAGFDMRYADRLFGVFQRLHAASEFPGHGVGLASVRRIVRRHGGEIWADAQPERGARFHFSLPGGEPASSVETLSRPNA